MKKTARSAKTRRRFIRGAGAATAPYFADMEGIGKRRMRGKSGYVPRDMTYQEWKDIYVDKTSTMEEWEAKHVDKSGKSGIIETRNEKGIEESVIEKDIAHDVAGGRRSPMYVLSEKDIEYIKEEVVAIGADPNAFVFNSDVVRGTCFLPSDGKIHVKGNVFPDPNSTHPRDMLSVRAVLAHEYYGHRPYVLQYLREENDMSADALSKINARKWADEFRASYMAAKNAPGLTKEDRLMLIRDALSRAEEVGVTIKYNTFIRRILHG